MSEVVGKNGGHCCFFGRETHLEFWMFMISCIWSNYSDLTRPHPTWWFSRGNPSISGKPRLVKYNNLARCIVSQNHCHYSFLVFESKAPKSSPQHTKKNGANTPGIPKQPPQIERNSFIHKLLTLVIGSFWCPVPFKGNVPLKFFFNSASHGPLTEPVGSIGLRILMGFVYIFISCVPGGSKGPLPENLTASWSPWK